MPPDRRSYSGAETAADLAAYHRAQVVPLQRSRGVVAAALSLLLLPLSWFASLALSVGAVCGIANMLAIHARSERLAETRSPMLLWS